MPTTFFWDVLEGVIVLVTCFFLLEFWKRCISTRNKQQKLREPVTVKKERCVIEEAKELKNKLDNVRLNKSLPFYLRRNPKLIINRNRRRK